MTSIAASLIALAFLPVTAQAQHRGPGVRSHGQPSHQQQRFHRRPFGSRLIVVAPFVPFGFYSTASVYSAPPVYDAPPPGMYPTPAAYGPPPAYAAPPAPLYPPSPSPLEQDIDPMPREVVFPTGRYVLRGDGINTPYTWVWVPNPPTAPPGSAAPDSGARDGDRVIYAWTDANGVTTWTDRLSRVPPEHRATARRDF